MASFFAKYPKVIYNNKIATDIVTRIYLRTDYTDKVSLYYIYPLQDGDTPEIVASKYYGDPEKHWIIMLINNIFDANFDFPLSYLNFENYLDKKYKIQGQLSDPIVSGANYARKTININPPGYRAILTTTDGISGVSTSQKFFIDENAYNGSYTDPTFNYADMVVQEGNITLEQTTETISIYDYEAELNEQKRNIKLLKLEYVSQFEQEFKTLMEL
jgi:hypothetical protein